MTTATPTIDSLECRRLLTEDPAMCIVDVRTGGEYESVHIPGSYNVPLDQLSEHAADLASLGQPLLLVCQSGARASQANTTLCAEGTKNLMLLEGGIEAWQATGGEVNRGTTEKWALDRQVRFAAGALSLAAIAVSIVVPQAKWLAGGIAAGMTHSAVTNTCAITSSFARLPYNQSANHDLTRVLASLRAGK